MSSPTQVLLQYLNSRIPAVVITFDDGKEAVYTEAFSYCQTKNVNCTSYTIQAYVDMAGYVTSAQLQTMNAGGWDIANHTVTHTDLRPMTDAERQAEFLDTAAFLDGLGLTRASKHVAYPWGAYNNDVIASMISAGMLTGRTIKPELFTIGDMFDNPYELPGFNVQNTVSLDDVKDYLNFCICQGKVAILYMHNLVAAAPGPGEWLISDFQDLIDWINSRYLISLTISQLYALNSSAIEYNNPWY